MKKIIILYLFSTFFAHHLLSIVYANTIEGNIIRINVENNTITELKEITWQESDTSSYFIDAFSVDTNYYLIKHCLIGFDENGPFEQVVALRKIININKNSSTTYLYIWNFIRLLGLVHFPPYIYKLNSGTWLFDDLSGRAFISNLDSIYVYRSFEEHKLIHISGQIDSNYVAVIYDQEDDSLSYYLDDLKDSPNYDLYQFNRIYINKKDIVISQIMNIFDNLYILNVDPFTLYTAIFINDTLQMKNKVELDLSLYSPFRWNYENEELYILYNDNLHKFDLFPGDTTFINKRLLITGKISIDFAHLLSSKIENNCLILYDIEKEEILKSIALDSINYSSSYRPIIDYPYVYIHQITKYSSIDIPRISLSKYNLCQNFPNPFNPSTQISYSIPQSGFVSLKMYNTLGQEINTLVNKSQVAGKYTISFNAQNLSSGIYFYKLQVGSSFVQTKKMILIR